ncbi:LADA_0D03994g1_1 [Lachancea dasiensis]|uniref:LADA_0D03994g1_1 n=1 Tax=Lachancea dasiensis TaxID=1072105 RepID=A0A1G4J578_9SACH|nr:LADA_0D03994g1_1 [Lachancea dasiensis]
MTDEKLDDRKRKSLDSFSPFWYISVMGTGISSALLHSFPYEARWLRNCSYIMFTLACLLLLSIMAVLIGNIIWRARQKSLRGFARRYFFDNSQNVFWGTLPMGWSTIVNYIFLLADNELQGKQVANRMVILVYVLWWISVLLALGTAWGITFCIWDKQNRFWDLSVADPHNKALRQDLQVTILLPVIPLVVTSSSSGTFTMSRLFVENTTRNVQLLTLCVTGLIYFNALFFVSLIMSTYIWHLYVNKLPRQRKVFTLFLLVGPMGQGAFGSLLFSNNLKTYIETYYPTSSADGDAHIISLAAQWSVKLFGILLALFLLANGIFFTLLSFGTILSFFYTLLPSYRGPRISSFNKSWWSMTFPLGTMALGTHELYQQYNPYVPISAFRTVSAIFASMCIVATIVCLVGTVWLYCEPFLKLFRKRKSPNESSDTSLC